MKPCHRARRGPSRGAVASSPLAGVVKCALCLVGLAWSGCGESDTPRDPSDGGTLEGGCAPQSVAGFAPTWRPPRAMRGACSDAQIETELSVCRSSAATTAGCAVFARDPANAACRECLYATEDESSFGPVVILKNRLLRVNVAGCLALADGNLAPTGCGAGLQTFQACGDAACMASCTDLLGFEPCMAQAGEGICRSHDSQSGCGEPAVYEPCFGHGSFDDFFRAIGRIFCGAGFPPRGDAGASDGGSGDAGSSDSGPSNRGSSEVSRAPAMPPHDLAGERRSWPRLPGLRLIER